MIAKPSVRGKWTGRVFLGASLGLLAATAALASGGEGGGGISPAKMTDFIWRSVNFVVFAAILIKLVAKPAKAFFGKRSQDIATSLEDLEAQKAAAAQAVKDAEARLAAVAAERDKILQIFIAEGEMEKAKIVQKAEAVAARIREMASLTIQQETKKAVHDLKVEVAQMATQLAEDLIKEKVTYADQQKLVGEYLKKVVEAH
jgi:F-type H+-transporting ATPase subunit b